MRMQLRPIAQLDNVLERAALAPLSRQVSGDLLRKPIDLPQAETKRPASILPPAMIFVGEIGIDGFERAVPFRMIDVDRQHRDAVLLRVADDLCRGVEAHRLRVEQRRRERGRVTDRDEPAGVRSHDARHVADGRRHHRAAAR